MENRGIDPRASRMLSERSTTWATAPFWWNFLLIFCRRNIQKQEFIPAQLFPIIGGVLKSDFPLLLGAEWQTELWIYASLFFSSRLLGFNSKHSPHKHEPGAI